MKWVKNKSLDVPVVKMTVGDVMGQKGKVHGWNKAFGHKNLGVEAKKFPFSIDSSVIMLEINYSN